MRALLRPGWMITHVVVIAIAVSFISFGLWQIRRHGEVAQDNERIEARLAADPITLDEALAFPDPDMRPVTVQGDWLADDEVTLSPRSRNERPGLDLLTPLRLPNGDVLLVNRGWIPLDDDPPTPPTGGITVTGRLRAAQPAPQVLTDDSGRITSMSRVDATALSAQVSDLIPGVYVELVDEDAREDGAIPRPASPIVLSAGPHISYAVQWFAFTAIGLIGYPLLLRRRMAEFQDDDKTK